MAGARWRITNDQPREELTPSGTFVASREITFEVLDNGRTGTVMIPLRNYNPDEVVSRIQQYADQIMAIGNLGG